MIVYLTHWFPSRDRARALAWFFVATPIAQIVSPKLSNVLLKIGTDERQRRSAPASWGWRAGSGSTSPGASRRWSSASWSCCFLTDRPGQAHWLEPDEREALEQELKREKARHHAAARHMSVLEALRHPKVLLLAAAYFFVVTGNYGVEFFLPSILEQWYDLKLDRLTWLVILPPIGSLVGQLFVGWSSDRTRERRLHAVGPDLPGGRWPWPCILMLEAAPAAG